MRARINVSVTLVAGSVKMRTVLGYLVEAGTLRARDVAEHLSIDDIKRGVLMEWLPAWRDIGGMALGICLVILGLWNDLLNWLLYQFGDYHADMSNIAMTFGAMVAIGSFVKCCYDIKLKRMAVTKLLADAARPMRSWDGPNSGPVTSRDDD
jgi:hypothetical protein